jgi:hypothetical protein
MPRIRSIKPEFWTDGAMIALPFEARLFYIGSWNFACDRGHLPDDPFGLKLKVLPADPVDGATLVQQLVESGRMERITLPDGRGFLGIPRFTDHQRIDTRWNSRCPVCAVIDSGELTETHASYDETHGDSHKLMLEGRGGERKGVGGETANAELSPFCPNHPNGTEKPCRACQNARLKYQAAQTSAKNKPTPTPRRAKECDLHPGYPLPCDRCARDAADAS